MSAVDELFWRDEILQALFWMHGEGLAESATASDLARFLAADEALLAGVLASMAAEGYVERVQGPELGCRVRGAGSRAGVQETDPLDPAPRTLHPSSGPYRLTPLGLHEGGRRFRDEFSGLTRQAHGECGPGCWCHDPEREGEPCPNRPEEEPERVRA